MLQVSQFKMYKEMVSTDHFNYTKLGAYCELQDKELQASTSTATPPPSSTYSFNISIADLDTFNIKNCSYINYQLQRMPDKVGGYFLSPMLSDL